MPNSRLRCYLVCGAGIAVASYPSLARASREAQRRVAGDEGAECDILAVEISGERWGKREALILAQLSADIRRGVPAPGRTWTIRSYEGVARSSYQRRGWRCTWSEDVPAEVIL